MVLFSFYFSTILLLGALGYAAMDGIGSALFFAAYERAKKYTTETLQLSGPWLGASVYGSAACAFGVSSIILGKEMISRLNNYTS